MQEKQDADSIDTGLHSLVLMARFHQVAASPAQLLHVRGKGNRVFSPEDLLHAARGLSLRARLVKSTISRLGSTPLPVMVQRHDGRWLILARFEGGKCLARTCESGIFLWDSRAALSGVSVKAGVCLTDLAISAVGMEKTFARVKPDNALANRHNSSLGFLPSGDHENSYLVLEKSRFLDFAPKLRRICSLGRDAEPASIEDVEFPDDAAHLELYDSLPEPARSVFARRIEGMY